MNKAKLPSGKFVLRVPTWLHAALNNMAKEKEISLNKACIECLERGLMMPGNASSIISSSLPILLSKLKEKVIGVVLFGSQARGDIHDSSDIDLLIVLADTVPITRNLYNEYETEKLSLHFAHTPKNLELAGSIWLEASIDGKVLFDRGEEISKILRNIRGIVSSGRVVRKETHGQGYWVRI